MTTATAWEPRVVIPKTSREILADVREILNRHVSHDDKVAALAAYFAGRVVAPDPAALFAPRRPPTLAEWVDL